MMIFAYMLVSYMHALASVKWLMQVIACSSSLVVDIETVGSRSDDVLIDAVESEGFKIVEVTTIVSIRHNIVLIIVHILDWIGDGRGLHTCLHRAVVRLVVVVTIYVPVVLRYHLIE